MAFLARSPARVVGPLPQEEGAKMGRFSGPAPFAPGHLLVKPPILLSLNTLHYARIIRIDLSPHTLSDDINKTQLR